MHWFHRTLWGDRLLHAVNSFLRELAGANLGDVCCLPFLALACVALLFVVTVEPSIQSRRSPPIVTGAVALGESIGQFRASSPWGPRRCDGCSPFHRGVDVAAPIGSPVYAAGASTHVTCKDDMLMQQLPLLPNHSIEILHTSECHPGIYPAGAVVGKSGTGGTGPHFHVQVRDERVYAINNEGRIPPSRQVLRAVIARDALK
jgi:hypothetical protein